MHTKGGVMPHIHTAKGQYDFTVSGYLIFNNKTLLIKHKFLPIWTPPAGHIELSQTPVGAVIKEIQEETGIEPSHLTIVDSHSYTKRFYRGESIRIPIPFDIEHHAITDDHRHINLAYIVLTDTGTIAPGPGESNTFRWFSEKEIQSFEETTESIKSCATYALQYSRDM
jgi:ADP-ribose pyrophosphatase YjhB (NUDIX family)